MKENGNKKLGVRVTEGTPNENPDVLQDNAQNKTEKLKKPIIFGLMGIVFVGCMWLIFKPSEDKNKIEDIGLNDAVPQATDAGLQSDKQKAYELEMLEQKNQEKRNGLTTLADYWNTDSANSMEPDLSEEAQGNTGLFSGNQRRGSNPALNSYQNAQSVLGSFYNEPNYETQELRKQLDELKQQLAEKDVVAPDPVETQLALMEKSYQMAAKYLPTNTPSQPTTVVPGSELPTTIPASSSTTQKEHFVAFTPVKKSAVSALYREPTDSAFLANWSETRNRGFYTAGVSEQVIQPKNSIRAVVQETQVVTGETGVRVRILEDAKTPNRTIPKGTVLTATAKFLNGRLQLKVTSVELEGNIIPVDITIYDIDGQQGLYVPYSPEMNALTEIAANMSQTSGTSIMMTRSAGQQVAGDLSRGVVQGVSGYFSKKVRTHKVTLKAGHQVFLVSKS